MPLKSSDAVTPPRVQAALQAALRELLQCRLPEGHWEGELSTSALSTATAVMAIAMVSKTQPDPQAEALIERGLSWLAAHQNPDGGWGDTTKSISNISTSMLCRATFPIAGASTRFQSVIERLESYLSQHCGARDTERAEAIRGRYGKDRTFAVPILTTCALAGLVDWREVEPLPFELACFPQSWFRVLRLHVVSYALPALIAMGQAIAAHRPSRNPIAWIARKLARRPTLRLLQAIQPSSGGYLEAVPLTSFVTISLASIGLAHHPVACLGIKFLKEAVRPDGSWPIDSNLSIWVTSLTVNALAAAGLIDELPAKDRVRDWLIGQQVRQRHPYTGAEPGGWGWSHLPGSVPDADDTPGALLALWSLGVPGDAPACQLGLNWLAGLQNRDGGWPTFCRGWGHLPFDRSGADLTAHALRAMVRCLGTGWEKLSGPYVAKCIPRGLEYLAQTQRSDGSWLPLWFGNQYAPDDENPVYGTARVLAAYRDLGRLRDIPAQRGITWLCQQQNNDGGWGGLLGVPSSIEETALAVEVLLAADDTALAQVNRGVAWLVQQVEAGRLLEPSPIGFYFAKLWYSERLYPVIFTVAALGRAMKISEPK